MSNTATIGSLPAIGKVPKNMLAQVVRQNRYGDPRTAFKIEEVEIP